MIPISGVRQRTAMTLLACLLLVNGPLMAETPADNPPSKAPNGHLYLVSAGVGDPDNITVRAQKTIAEADIVFGMERMLERYADLLQGKETYEAGHGLFRPMRQRPSQDRPEAAQAGQEKHGAQDEHRQRREEARATLEAQARKVIREAVNAGKTVAVLDSGDPSIYGPHTGYLTEFADLNPVVIPGLSSFNAANAALGRGITQGEQSRSVILTRTPGDPLDDTGLDTLKTLAESRSTMVFFTMRSKLPEFVARVKDAYPGDTPIAIVSNAGYQGRERVIEATLDSILEHIGDQELPFEHLIYLGDSLK